MSSSRELFAYCCYWAATVFGVTDVSLEPDVEVATSFADYAAGRDAVLTAALERARDLE